MYKSPSYSVEKGNQNDMILKINGAQSRCPFTPPFPVQGSMGQVQIVTIPCSTACPLASINDMTYEINCSSLRVTFELDNVSDESKPSKLTLV